jgi:hypothetical protein
MGEGRDCGAPNGGESEMSGGDREHLRVLTARHLFVDLPPDERIKIKIKITIKVKAKSNKKSKRTVSTSFPYFSLYIAIF